ncbi:Lrp/AsnC family transcriptional regulator [Streptomyces sp. LHD-70]|uniref:Lrp/AsnC family transcriptional regulator n=1 Tax=Streptomyces sp. LHD-70 TaxID=3072140 RepID=UPI00280FFD1D|nr:Lrp/AsnC family transcriptional regulator [Streptomyces sp. LHD-70]MDQ8702594.1 Lrp/AsnC family transcriptional regulator [Streptomyces sp. LHD-70]
MTELDDLDRAIIAELEQDGRRAFREIARSLDVSEGTVRSRFRRLEESGVLKITAFADPGRFSQGRLAQIFLRVAPDHHDAVVAALCACVEISYVSTTLGRADVFAQVLVADDRDLWEFLHRRVRPLEGVTDVESVLEVAVHKLWFDGQRPTEEG